MWIKSFSPWQKTFQNILEQAPTRAPEYAVASPCWGKPAGEEVGGCIRPHMRSWKAQGVRLQWSWWNVHQWPRRTVSVFCCDKGVCLCPPEAKPHLAHHLQLQAALTGMGTSLWQQIYCCILGSQKIKWPQEHIFELSPKGHWQHAGIETSSRPHIWWKWKRPCCLFLHDLLPPYNCLRAK